MSYLEHQFTGITLGILLILVLFSPIIHIPEALGEGTGDYPPPVTGDWTVMNTTHISNETIFLEGTLNVTNNAILTLENVNLIFNHSSAFTPRIYVHWGAELNVINSEITSTQTLYSFEANGNLSIDKSRLSRIDGGIRLNLGNYTISNSALFNNPRYAVMCVGDFALYYNESLANVVLLNNTIHSNYCGLVVSYFHRPYLHGNTISNNEWGIICQVFGSLKMFGNNVSSNTLGGIKGELGYYWMENNTISSNGGFGIKSDHTTIYAYNNTIFDNELWGLYAFNAPITHDNNTFSKDGASGSQGGMLQEWEIVVNVKDDANKTLSGVHLTVYDVLGNMIWNATTIGGVRRIVLREFEISNDGTEINHMPFTINARKGNYYNTSTYELDPYEEITIVLEYEPDLPRKEQKTPFWIIAFNLVFWLVVLVLVIIGFTVNTLRNKNPR